MFDPFASLRQVSLRQVLYPQVLHPRAAKFIDGSKRKQNRKRRTQGLPAYCAPKYLVVAVVYRHARHFQ
jgi:hypothetical protein